HGLHRGRLRVHSDGRPRRSWDGTGWTLTTMGGPGDTLNAVSVPVSSFCVAAGAPNDNDKPLAESWDGTTWAPMPLPARSQAWLSSISCATPSVCVAVG